MRWRASEKRGKGNANNDVEKWIRKTGIGFLVLCVCVGQCFDVVVVVVVVGY